MKQILKALFPSSARRAPAVAATVGAPRVLGAAELRHVAGGNATEAPKTGW